MIALLLAMLAALLGTTHSNPEYASVPVYKANVTNKIYVTLSYVAHRALVGNVGLL